MPFVEMLMKSVGGDAARELSSQLNIDMGKAAQILPRIAPLILAGLKKQKSEPGGEERVAQLVKQYGNPSALQDVGQSMKQGAADPRLSTSLNGLLGDSGKQATDLLSKDLGIDATSASRILPMVTPLILGALSKLQGEGGGLKALTSLLDKEGNADLLGNVRSLLGGQGAGGLLGKALGSLLKGSK